MNLTFGFGSQPYLAIDPGRHTLKIGVGHLGSKGRSASLHSIYTVRTGLTPQDSADRVLERTGDLILEVLKRHNLSAKQVCFAIPGRVTFVRQIKVPRVSGDRLKRLIMYEARQQIPFDLNDVILDWHVFPSDTPELGVTLVAIRKTIVDQLCGMLAKAGLVPDIIDVSTLTLFDAYYPQLKEEPEQVVALVDIGASTTDIVVSRNRQVEFIRPAPLAGDHLTKALVDNMSLSWEAAEEMKITVGGLDPSIDRQTDPLAYGERDQAARARFFLSRSFEAIANEIRRTLDFYVSQPDGVPIGKIYLTGGTTNLPGIESFIQSRLNISCEVKNPFDHTLVNVEDLDAESIQTVLRTTSATLIGQSQRAIADVPLRMNFLPAAIVRQKEFQKRRTVLIIEGVLLAVLIGFSVVTVSQTIEVLRAAKDSLEDKLAGTKDETARQIQEYISNTRTLEDRFNILRDIGRSRGVISRTLAEVSSALPLGETWLENIEIDTTRIQMNVRGQHDESVNSFKDKMQEVSRLRKLKIDKSTRMEQGGIQFKFDAEVEKRPSVEVSRIREKLENRGVEFYDVTFEDTSQPAGSKKMANIVITIPDPSTATERADGLMDVLNSVEDAALGYEAKSVSVVFHSFSRQEVGRYELDDNSIQAILKGTMAVSDLTLVPPAVQAPSAPQ